MAAPTAREVSGEAGVATLLKLALPALPVLGSLPGVAKQRGVFEGLSLTRPAATPTRAEVDAYADLCGFPRKDVLPLPYPHLLVFGLHLAIMGDPAFPVPAMGMIHLENSITQHRPVAVGETLHVSASVTPGVAHPVGTAFGFQASVQAGPDGTETVWEETSVYLRRGRRDPAATWDGDLVEVPPSGPVWRLDAGLGRRYARVSGDFNPIHLTALSAKALGQPRQMAHGMWTLARCVAQLENRLPDAVRVEAAFKKPVFLPSSVAYGARPAPDGYAFSLHRRGSETLHLLGRTTSL